MNEMTPNSDDEKSISKLMNPEIVQVTRLLIEHGIANVADNSFVYHDGWSDERIAAILRAAPGREHLKASSVARLRRESFGDTAEEAVRKELMLGNPMNTAARITALEERLSKLERALGIN